MEALREVRVGGVGQPLPVPQGTGAERGILLEAGQGCQFCDDCRGEIRLIQLANLGPFSQLYTQYGL